MLWGVMLYTFAMFGYSAFFVRAACVCLRAHSTAAEQSQFMETDTGSCDTRLDCLYSKHSTILVCST